MKQQMKLFLVGLLVVVMGMSVTSCLKGDEGGPTQGNIIAEFDYMTSSFKTMDGMKWVPTDPASIMFLDPGMYSVNIQYNYEDVTANATSIPVTLLSEPVSIAGPDVTSEPETANAAMYALTVNPNSSNGYMPVLFNRNTLLLPAMFYYKAAMTATEWDAEMAKHKFIISYDEDEVAAGGETLNLYVNHVITETEDENNSRTSTTVDYKAYDISHIVSSNLKKIVLHAKVNTSSLDLDGATETTFDIDYTKFNPR